MTICLFNKFNCLLILGLFWAVMAHADERFFKVFDASNGLADNSAQTINCTYTGRMVISTIGHVNFYDGKEFSHVDSEQEDIYSLPNYNGKYKVYFDKHHHLWLKDRNVVTCVNLLTERFMPEIDDVFEELGVTTPVHDVFADSESHLWLMTSNRLVGIDNKVTIPIVREAKLQDMDVMEPHLFMFLSNGEVVCSSLTNGQIEYREGAFTGSEAAEDYSQTSQLLKTGHYFYQIRTGRKGSLLLCFDTKKRSWSTVLSVPYLLNDIVEHDSILYMASSLGYWTYDIPTKETTHVSELTMTDGRKLQTDINCIEFDRQGGMWMGTEKRGLLYSRPDPTPFKILSVNDGLAAEYLQKLKELPQEDVTRYGRNVNTVLTDSRGWTWIGTLTGLKLLRGQALPQSLSGRDGLLNNVIHSIVEDDENNVWVSTSGGITCFIINNNAISGVHSFNRYDNVPTESFLNGKVLKLDNGTIVMQGIEHLVCFNPSQFTTLHPSTRFKFYPKLIRLMVNGSLVEAGSKLDGKVILEKAITRTREINLNYNQNTLALTFSGLNYFRPLQTYYRYRVLGYDEKWHVLSYFNSNGQVDMQGLFHLTLAALPPGEYVLEIQASFYENIWNVEPMQLVIKINQPWWRSTGVYLLLLLVVAVLALVNVIVYSRNYRMRMKRNNEEDDVVKRIRNFIERCLNNEEKLLPRREEIYGQGSVDDRIDVTPAFQQVMMSIAPYLKKHSAKRVTMRELAELSDMPIGQFYDLISSNLHKSPRMLALTLSLQHAAKLLRENPQMRIDDIAAECSFGSPNYFIAAFYRQYKMTPKDYRSCR